MRHDHAVHPHTLTTPHPHISTPSQVRYKLETQQQEDLKKEQLLDQQQRVKRIAREMSDLVVYCRPTPFLLEGGHQLEHMHVHVPTMYYVYVKLCL